MRSYIFTEHERKIRLEWLKTGRRTETTNRLVFNIEMRGSAPRGVGAKMLIETDGNTVGTIGGGDMERRVVKEPLEAWRKGRPRILTFALGVEAKGDAIPVDSKCGGVVKVLLDIVKPDPRLIIVGSGHVAKPLGSK